MPVWAIVLLVIAGILLAVLLSSITLYLRYEEDLSLQVGIWGLRFWLINPEEPEEDDSAAEKPPQKQEKIQKEQSVSPKTEKQKKASNRTEKREKEKPSDQKPSVSVSPKKEKQTAKEKARSLSEKHPKKDFAQTVYFALDLIKALLPPAVDLLSHLRITRLKVFISVGEEEADQTAYAYAAVNTAVYNTLAMLKSLILVKVEKIEIFADFVTGETRQFYSFRVKLRICHLLAAAVRMLFRFLGIAKEKETNEASPTASRSEEKRKK